MAIAHAICDDSTLVPDNISKVSNKKYQSSPTDWTGAGTATFEIQTASFPSGSEAVAAHIHPGEAGRNGGVLVSTLLAPADPIALGAGSVSRTLTAPITQVDATNITANPGAYYFNVHTRANGSGVMRGQLNRQ